MYCFSQFCRLCVSTNRNLVNIFYMDDDLQSLSDKMTFLLPEIVYDEDNLPNLVCDQCCNNLKKMYEFKKRCLKNNEILKLYASKLLTMKESPENIELESELKLIQKQISEENTDVDISLIFIKQEIETKPHIDDCKLEPETEIPITVKDEPLENIDTDIKSETNAPELSSSSSSTTSSSESETEHQEFEDQELVVNKTSVEETRTYSRKSVIDSNLSMNKNDSRFNNEPDLKLECTEEDDESFSEDAGDESMDCDEVISINDSENDNGDEDMIHIPEPMNLTAKALNNPLLGTLDSPNMCLPPHLASGNRGKTRTNDKYRMVYTEHQRLELEKEYLLNRFVPDRRRAELAIGLSLTVRQIKIWFQNRRAKERRETKRTDTSPHEVNSQKVPAKVSTPDHQRKSTETRQKDKKNTLEDYIRKQQEYTVQQQILQQQREIMVQEQLLRQRKEYLTQQQSVLQNEFHQQLFPHQQEVLRQEEYIRQQKQFFNQQQQYLRQQNLLPENLLQQQASLLLSQPLLVNTILQQNQSAMLSNLSNQHLPQDLFPNLTELAKRKDILKRAKVPVEQKELLPNLEELYRRKQELLKRNEERLLKDNK